MRREWVRFDEYPDLSPPEDVREWKHSTEITVTGIYVISASPAGPHPVALRIEGRNMPLTRHDDGSVVAMRKLRKGQTVWAANAAALAVGRID